MRTSFLASSSISKFEEGVPRYDCELQMRSDKGLITWLELNEIKPPWIVPALCACVIILVGVVQYSIVRGSIEGVVLQRAAKLPTVIYDRSTVQCGCIRSICHDQVQISGVSQNTACTCSSSSYVASSRWMNCQMDGGEIMNLIRENCTLYRISNSMQKN